jgi:hypothetical protein
MPGYDANMELVDGSADWTYANLVTSKYGAPTSITRNSGGFVVLKINGTPADGLAVVLTLKEANADGDALIAILQGCDDYDFSSSKVHRLATFEVDAATEGVVLGSETPITIIRRFATRLKYVRLYAVCTASDDFGASVAYLLHGPFEHL